MRTIARWIGIERVVGLVLLILFVALRGWDPGPLETFRLQVFDLYQIAKPRVPSSYPAVIIDVDEKSLKAIGQWPWPRDTIAKLIDGVADGGAKAVAFDMLFAEPDRLSPGLIAKSISELDEATRSKLSGLPANEEIMAQSFKRLPVVLGLAGTIAQQKSVEQVNIPGSGITTLGGDPRAVLVGFPGVIANLSTLEKAAGRGLFSIRPERDGVIRRIATVMNAGGKLMPSLAIELLRVSQQGSSTWIKRDQAGVQGIGVGKIRLPTDRHAQLWVHYSKRDPKRYVSAVDVLNGKVASDRLKDKLVLVGTSAAGLFDLRSTPLDRVMPGVEIHAQKIEAILTDGLLSRPHYALGAEVSLALVIGLIIIILAPMLGAFPVLFLGAIIAASMAGVSWYLFDQHRILLDVAYPLLSSAIVFLVLTYVNYMREEAQRTQIRTAFSQYLSPDLVAQLTKDPDRLVLGGETRELTILFSDVRGFTSIAESYRDNPAELTNLMNRLLTPLSNAIIERRGTIDKYMGDAVMAFWNAPLDDADHALHAGRSALEMSARIKSLNAVIEAEAQQAGRAHLPMNLGIGVATGSSVVGNMGSDLRFDYSVLGDTVNLASRLEGLTAQLRVPNLVSNTTARAVADVMATIEVDMVRVKGKNEPECVHVLVGDQAVLSNPAYGQLRSSFDQFLGAYRRRDWANAKVMIEQLKLPAAEFGIAGVLDVYGERIAGFELRSPDEAWDGVFDAEKK